ncbi:hypothetical protein V1273_002306 [Bradyrhizobium sp. AZCC 1721]
MHHHFRMHVIDPVIVVVAVPERRDPRHRPLLGIGVGNAALLRRGMLFLDDAECEFAEVAQLDLLLLVQARCQFARIEKGDAEQPGKAQADEGIDLSANRQLGPAYHSKHAWSPTRRRRSSAPLRGIVYARRFPPVNFVLSRYTGFY